MKRSIIVVGGGAAGLAAAWSARREGRDVTIVVSTPGASSLGGGAVDDIPWERIFAASRDLGGADESPELPGDVAEFSSALGLWSLPIAPAPRPKIATASGRIRPARGLDRSLFNLAELRWGRVILPRVERAGWDADAIAAALSADPFARERGVRFDAVDARVLRLEDERRFPDADLAASHDEPARLAWLAGRLVELLKSESMSSAPVLGILLGPWLGAIAPRADELSEKVGVRVGEALVGAGSPAGLRFDAARDRLLSLIGASVVRDRATAITPERDRVEVTLDRAAAPLVADAVVLAVGGVISGGVTYAPPESFAGVDLPSGVRAPFELSLRAPVTLSLGGREALGVVSSMHGPELDLCAWPALGEPAALESVGVACKQGRAAPMIVAAGDVIAGRPRTLLEAVMSGLRAGREA